MVSGSELDVPYYVNKSKKRNLYVAPPHWCVRVVCRTVVDDPSSALSGLGDDNGWIIGSIMSPTDTTTQHNPNLRLLHNSLSHDNIEWML